jgi:hypothetical protein
MSVIAMSSYSMRDETISPAYGGSTDAAGAGNRVAIGRRGPVGAKK